MTSRLRHLRRSSGSGKTRVRVGPRLSITPLLAKLKLGVEPLSAPLPTLEDFGLHLTQTIFEASEAAAQASLRDFAQSKLREYADNRDNTGDDQSTSALSVHLKYGTLSVRDCWREAEG